MPAQVTQYRYKTALEISRKFPYIKQNLKAEPGQGTSYLYYRAIRPFLKLYYKLYRWRFPNTPWTSPASVAIFDALLTKEMRGFEYGSGNSTKYFAGKLGKLVSVEHNAEWYAIVKKQLQDLNINNVQFEFIAENTSGKTNYVPDFAAQHKLENTAYEAKPEFYDYYHFITTFPDDYFDFVLVDGRARVECALNAIPKLKQGGLLVLDNSERPHYKPIHERLTGWPVVNTSVGVTDTTIWFKP